MHYWRFSGFSGLQCYRLGAFYDIIEGGRRSMVALSLLEILFRVDTPSDSLARQLCTNDFQRVGPESISDPPAAHVLEQPVGPGPAPPPPGLAVSADLQLAIAQLLTALGGMKQAPAAILAPAPVPVPTPKLAVVLTPILAPESTPAPAPN
ncbi:cyclin-dependent kinase inhibitor 1C-like [Solanum tuberosum]|uniref:cyclin-dependent kinase inhibitor 1C-like n=1 Tax=Solanum tuberosum TaxID=4113 RepID=UPI00073A5148|nr:PREDICTED: cyclin-dependent kinase inhibitor 1C-like [Solanum tuberosum]